MDYIKHYQTDAEEFDYFAKRKGASLHDERRVREYLISEIPELAKSFLDIGCGSAWVAETLTAKGLQVTSLDVSFINTSKAKEKFPSKLHTQITADSFHLPIKDNSYDCVISSEVIEHVTDPAAFVKELFRVVKQGGTLILTTPYKEKLQYSLCIHCNQKTPLHSHIHSFDLRKLMQLYKGSDIQDFEHRIFGNKLLIFLRTYSILKFFPFILWKFVDKIANKIYNKPVHILVKMVKF